MDELRRIEFVVRIGLPSVAALGVWVWGTIAGEVYFASMGALLLILLTFYAVRTLGLSYGMLGVAVAVGGGSILWALRLPLAWSVPAFTGMAAMSFVIIRVCRRLPTYPPPETSERQHTWEPTAAEERSSRREPEADRSRTRPSAAAMLDCLEELRRMDAQWHVIETKLNPGGDPEVQRLLVAIRGPYRFTPHLALGLIEAGCREALAESIDADALRALQCANDSRTGGSVTDR
jgi:hypothetical protein